MRTANQPPLSTWKDEVYDSLRVRLRLSFLLNSALMVLLIVGFIIIAALVPLKTSVPFVISHNETTGEITQLGNLNPADYETDWRLTRFFLIRYITNRESFHSDNLERPYQIAYTMSDKKVALAYEVLSSTNNPASPYQKYGKSHFVTVEVHSISKLNAHTAEVHFTKTVHDKNNAQETKIPYVTIVKWRYDKVTQTPKALDRNPLGFHVTYYQPSFVNTTE